MVRYVLLSLLSVVMLGNSSLFAADDKKPKAADVLAGGLAKAKKEGKAVFLAFGSSDEDWSKRLKKFHESPTVAKTLGKHLVFVTVDVAENPGAAELYEKYAPEDAGIPMWVILSADGKVLVDALEDVKGEKKNVGFPYEANELTHYEKAVRKAVPKLTDAEMAEIMKELKAAGPKKERVKD